MAGAMARDEIESERDEHAPLPLLVVSNRMPVSLARDGNGWHARRSSGGLVSALAPVMEEHGGAWIGWAGAHLEPGEGRPDLAAAFEGAFEPRPVWLEPEPFEAYYEGFANSILWPLFHGISEHCDFDPSFYEACLEATELFADETMRAASERGRANIWVQDYQLIFLGQKLRERGSKNPLGFFLHIPFPPALLLARLPWRDQLIEALLAYDHIGFQSQRDLRHFGECLAELAPAMSVEDDDNGLLIHTRDGRRVAAAVHPIGISAGEMEQLVPESSKSEAMARVGRWLGDRKLVLGVDRLDYSKGIPERLAAFEHLLESRPELADDVVLLQVVVPSRETVPAYAELKRSIEREIGRINGAFNGLSGMPIHYHYGSVPRHELAALMALAEVALVTPLCDGMNLVAKEYCDAQHGEQGVLVLSEMAGAADQLREGAILVNPFDIAETAQALDMALEMPAAERRRRMQAMREVVRREDVFRWASRFIDALAAATRHAEGEGSEPERPEAQRERAKIQLERSERARERGGPKRHSPACAGSPSPPGAELRNVLAGDTGPVNVVVAGPRGHDPVA